MGFNKFHGPRMVGVDIGIQEGSLKGWDIHKTLCSRSNAKVQMSNETINSNVKCSQPPLPKGKVWILIFGIDLA